MANINAILSGSKLKRESVPSTYEIKMIHYTKLRPSKMQNREERNIEELADLLELSGEIKQPLLVRRAMGDTYEVIAGHRRRLAAIYNVEQKGLQKFAFLPCKVDVTDDVESEINLIITNTGTDGLTDMELVEAVMRLKELLPRKETSDLKGRELRKRIAETLNKSVTKIGQLEHIGNNLSQEGKKALEERKINVSVADALASLSVEEQKRLLKKDSLQLKDVELKKRKAKEKTLEVESQNSLETYLTWDIWMDIEETRERYYRQEYSHGTVVIKAYYYIKNGITGWHAEEYYWLPEGMNQYFRNCRKEYKEILRLLTEDT